MNIVKMLMVVVIVVFLGGCSRVWLDSGICIDTTTLPNVDVAGKLVNGGDLIKYTGAQTERCVKLNVGNKNLSTQ